MTICIAAICDDFIKEPKIVFLSDKQISGDIEFDRFMPKMRWVTSNCVILEASDDVLISESILDNVEEKLKEKNGLFKIKEIVGIVSKECAEFKKKEIERKVLEKYTHTADYLNLDRQSVLQYALQERLNYKYAQFEYIILGLDIPQFDPSDTIANKYKVKPHIFTVDQDGKARPFDSFGFAVTGSGSDLAFSELTKWDYKIIDKLSVAITKVYFARKEAERGTGVGDTTSFAVMTFFEDDKTHHITPIVKEIPEFSNYTKILDSEFKRLNFEEMNVIRSTAEQIATLLKEEPQM